eukprot:jgi/Chrzof1/9135/Cz03g37070.t1
MWQRTVIVHHAIRHVCRRTLCHKHSTSFTRRPDVRAYNSFSQDLLGPHFQNRARITDDLIQALVELPGK